MPLFPRRDPRLTPEEAVQLEATRIVLNEDVALNAEQHAQQLIARHTWSDPAIQQAIESKDWAEAERLIRAIDCSQPLLDSADPLIAPIVINAIDAMRNRSAKP